MVNLFKKLFRKNLKTSPEHTTYSPEENNDDGKWKLKVSCNREYRMGYDDFVKGCGATYIITEDDLSSGGCLWRRNAIFGWRCKKCNLYHGVSDIFIPEYVKDNVFYREHPEKLANNIVNFSDYKKTKSKK